MADDIRLARIEHKLDKVVDHIGVIDVTLQKNTDSLQAHMMRTAILERALFPMKRVWDFCVVAGQLICGLGVLAAITEAVIQLLAFLHGRSL